MPATDAIPISKPGELKALIVDDQSIMREFLKSILRALNVVNIDDAGNGEEAANLYRYARHDIVFMDIDMPGVNGFGALQQLQVINPNVFVVMVSAHSSVDNVKESLEIGAKGFIVKPYTSAKIAQMVKKYQGLNNKTGSTRIRVNDFT